MPMIRTPMGHENQPLLTSWPCLWGGVKFHDWSNMKSKARSINRENVHSLFMTKQHNIFLGLRRVSLRFLDLEQTNNFKLLS